MVAPHAALRLRLRDGEVVIGTFVKSPDPAVSELLAGVGFDFLIADLEHSSLAHSDVEAIARAAELRSIPVFARISASDIAGVGRLLDAGVAGIQVTDVTDAATLVALRDAMAFPPKGRRSLALSHRAARFGQLPLGEFLREADEGLATIAQIESQKGIDALEMMLDTAPAPDAWFIGPFDLSNDLQHPGDQDHPDVQRAIGRILMLLAARGARVGAYARDADDARDWLARGASLIVVGSDVAFLSSAARAAIEAITQVSGRQPAAGIRR